MFSQATNKKMSLEIDDGRLYIVELKEIGDRYPVSLLVDKWQANINWDFGSSVFYI